MYPKFTPEQFTDTTYITDTSVIRRHDGSIIKAYGDEVGKVVKVKTVELGRGYENSPTPPTLTFFNNVIVTNISGTFIATQSITSSSGGSGTIVSLDSDRGLLKIKQLKYDEALTDINKYITSEKNNSLAYRSRGIIYLNSGNFDKACSDLLISKNLNDNKTEKLLQFINSKNPNICDSIGIKTSNNSSFKYHF